MEDTYTFAVLLGGPLASFWVSIAYFRSTPAGTPLSRRIAVSAHGASGTVLYLLAWLISPYGLSRPAYATPYMWAFSLPAMLILLSLLKFNGRSSIHALQLVNVPALFLTWVIGTMAVTGEWL